MLPLVRDRWLFAQRLQPLRLTEQHVADKIARRQNPLFLAAEHAVRALSFLKTLHDALCLNL
ncbi:hypothetical protein D3C71_1884520 [compost metagenome]